MLLICTPAVSLVLLDLRLKLSFPEGYSTCHQFLLLFSDPRSLGQHDRVSELA